MYSLSLSPLMQSFRRLLGDVPYSSDKPVKHHVQHVFTKKQKKTRKANRISKQSRRKNR